MKEVYRIVSNASAEELEKMVNELIYFSEPGWKPVGGLVLQPNGILLQPMVYDER